MSRFVRKLAALGSGVALLLAGVAHAGEFRSFSGEVWFLREPVATEKPFRFWFASDNLKIRNSGEAYDVATNDPLFTGRLETVIDYNFAAIRGCLGCACGQQANIKATLRISETEVWEGTFEGESRPNASCCTDVVAQGVMKGVGGRIDGLKAQVDWISPPGVDWCSNPFGVPWIISGRIH